MIRRGASVEDFEQRKVGGMRFAILVVSVSCFLLAAHASDTPATQASVNNVDITLHTGERLRCEYEFYPDGWTATIENPGDGLIRHYMAVYHQYSRAKNLDEWLATATKRSVSDWAPKHRALLEKMKFDQPKTYDAKRFFLAVMFEDGSGKHMFLCLHPVKPDAKFADGYIVSAMTEEDGQWKMDYTMSSHPLFKRILSRNLSDFGGPNLPKERADEVRTTQHPPASQPASTQP